MGGLLDSGGDGGTGPDPGTTTLLGIEISNQQLTDINPFDESVYSEILGGTTPYERSGGDQPGYFEDVLDIADPNTSIEGSDLENYWNENTADVGEINDWWNQNTPDVGDPFEPPTWWYGVAALVVLVLLSDYADLGAAALDST